MDGWMDALIDFGTHIHHLLSLSLSSRRGSFCAGERPVDGLVDWSRYSHSSSALSLSLTGLRGSFCAGREPSGLDCFIDQSPHIHHLHHLPCAALPYPALTSLSGSFCAGEWMDWWIGFGTHIHHLHHLPCPILPCAALPFLNMEPWSHGARQPVLWIEFADHHNFYHCTVL